MLSDATFGSYFSLSELQSKRKFFKANTCVILKRSRDFAALSIPTLQWGSVGYSHMKPGGTWGCLVSHMLVWEYKVPQGASEAL